MLTLTMKNLRILWKLVLCKLAQGHFLQWVLFGGAEGAVVDKIPPFIGGCYLKTLTSESFGAERSIGPFFVY